MKFTPISDMTHEEARAYRGLIDAQALAHKTATDAGWHDKPREVGTFIALMHSELSEAMEADRKGQMDDKLPHRPGIEVELGDCLIRILDFAAEHNFDVAGAVIEKNRFNQVRADHRPENRAASGGKKY